MQYITLLLTLIMGLSLTACSEKDKDYYLNNPNKAKEKLSACKIEAKEAFKDGNKEKLEQLYDKKSECHYAKEAVKFHRKQQYEKEQEEKAAKQKAELDKALAEVEKQHGKLSWQAYAKYFVSSQCRKSFILDTNYRCKAELALYEKKKQEGLAELQQQGFDKLATSREVYCSKDARKYSACDIWKVATKEQGIKELSQLDFKALLKKKDALCTDGWSPACQACNAVKKEKEKTIVTNYINNYEQLKKDYNQCVDDYQKAPWTKKSAVAISYPCYLVQSARSELRLRYNNFSKKMD